MTAFCIVRVPSQCVEYTNEPKGKGFNVVTLPLLGIISDLSEESWNKATIAKKHLQKNAIINQIVEKYKKDELVSVSMCTSDVGLRCYSIIKKYIDENCRQNTKLYHCREHREDS